MTRLPPGLALTATLAALAVATAACSPKTPTAERAATAPTPPPAVAQANAPALPAACQSLLASMQSCSETLTAKGSPLGAQIRLSMDDMRGGIAHAPPGEQSAFCDTEATAFKQRAQAAHC